MVCAHFANPLCPMDRFRVHHMSRKDNRILVDSMMADMAVEDKQVRLVR